MDAAIDAGGGDADAPDEDAGHADDSHVPDVPAPAEPRIVYAVDVSHWTRTLTDPDVDCLAGLGYEHVIVGTQIPEVTRQQLEIAIRGGMTVDLYVYLYWTESVASEVRDALALAAEFPEVGRIWLDVEEDPGSRSAAELEHLVEEALDALGDFPGGIYTGRGFWTSYMDDSHRFAELPLWYAHYDHEPSLETWEPFGGWTEPMGKQYADHHEHTCGLPMDRNVMWSSATPSVVVDRSVPPDDGDPPPAPSDLRPDGIVVTTDYLRPTAPTVWEATGYTIELQFEGASGWAPYTTLERSISAGELHPVVDDTRYRFRMRASNRHGSSPWSAWAEIRYFPSP
jgi:hypothetical protein